MKILIVSDTHGKEGNLREALKREQPIDMLVHCGDVEGREEKIREMAGCHTEIIAGNNDFFTTLEREKEIWVGRNKVLLTHGHYYKVTLGPELLMEDAAARGYQVALYGHTHRPLIVRGPGIVVANPGSLSYPRQDGKQASYMIIEMDRQGELEFTIKYLDLP